MLGALLWMGSFVFLAVAPLLPRAAIVTYLCAVTVLYTVAVMVHAGVIDALVVEAAPDMRHASGPLRRGVQSVLGRGERARAWPVHHHARLVTGLPWIVLAALLLLALVGVGHAEPRLA